MNDQFSGGQDLPQLVLAIAMDRYAGAVQPGGEVVPRASVDVDLYAIGPWSEPAAEEALPMRPEDHEALPALLRAVADDEGHPPLPLHGESGAIDGQDLLVGMRRPQHLEVVQVDQRDWPD